MTAPQGIPAQRGSGGAAGTNNMDTRRGFTTHTDTSYRTVKHDGFLQVETNRNSQTPPREIKVGYTMPLSQEQRTESNFSNNNDQNYLHKKFKKVASTVVSTCNTTAFTEYKSENVDLNKISTDNSQTNSDISKCRLDRYHNVWSGGVENVQSNLNSFDNRLSDVNNSDQSSGRTRATEEFPNKTETELTRDVHSSTGGRYMCPYCKLSCAKPSVLQKHIRAHTNERPFPCVPCGFAFKTKSNLYKHRRSRTHALRLQGVDEQPNEDDLSPDSESDTSLPATSISDTGSETSAATRLEFMRPNEFSSPELQSDRNTPPSNFSDTYKLKSIYKPKFRAALYQVAEDKDKLKKTFTPNSLNEHISKIISDNEAIVDVIDTPLQKKYGKIKQIAENHLVENIEVKHDHGPLNLTKSNNESEKTFRKRSHSESFSRIDFNKHPLNPEGSIIKDLLLKTKANGLVPLVNFETTDGQTLYICPLCQISYRSADNLEIHRLYYCKGNSTNNSVQKETKPNHIYVRSNSVSAHLPDTQSSMKIMTVPIPSPPTKVKPDNLIITKTELNEIVAPLPSPGPLLGNTRLVDSRMPSEYSKNIFKPILSPKRRLESRSDSYSPRLENVSPLSIDTYTYSKIRCIEPKTTPLRSMEDLSQLNSRHNSKSLHMFGGEVKIVDQSGGTTTLRIEPSKNELSPIIIQQNISPSKFINDAEASSIVVRSGLHSGGTLMHNTLTPKEVHTPQGQRLSASGTSSASSTIVNIHDLPRFQFPPLSAITAYNPLTLPPLSPSTTPNGTSTILHAGKLIPHVPGMPGPVTPPVYVGSPSHKDVKHKNIVYKHDVGQRHNLKAMTETEQMIQSPNSNKNSSLSMIRIKHAEGGSTKPTILINDRACSIKQETSMKRNVDSALRSPAAKETPYLSPKIRSVDKISNAIISKKTGTKMPENEVRNFNFESLITKAEIYSNKIASTSDSQDISNVSKTSTTVHSSSAQLNVERSETSYFQKTQSEDKKPKFLRPSTLPLKPGTFTPKRHHGITPNANTMPLVSPETPRPAKAYGQLYLNGNAYTYLGLKCSTKVFYCTINRPQPTYVPNQRFLSMYSNWQLLSDLPLDPLGLSTPSAMSLYDSRHRPQNIVVAAIKREMILTHSSQWNKNFKECKQMLTKMEVQRIDECIQATPEVSMGPKKELAGGFESNEEYTYIRGRGRGRYVCSECGIRCKKPSMLKKHIRTHTDVRPFTCVHCSFSFKTKGNLTKHMKSKAHYKKCCELGINPEEGTDMETSDVALCSGETDDESDSDGDEGNEGETESSDTEGYKSRLPEHEAAHCLLSLGGARPANNPGLITSARPSTYPYTPIGKETSHGDVSNTTQESSLSESENEPMDLSKSEVKTPTNLTEIPTARESSVLASLASNTAKLPQQNTEWTNGEPMLHAYLTERALLDTKIKLSQLSNQNRIKKSEHDRPAMYHDEKNIQINVSFSTLSVTSTVSCISSSSISKIEHSENIALKQDNTTPVSATPKECSSNAVDIKKSRSEGNSENAKFVVSEYLKQARGNATSEEDPLGNCEVKKSSTNDIGDDMSDSDINIGSQEHDTVARKVVIGAGGVAFKVGKGKDFENSFSSGRLMEDGRRVCDFCNKSFTKPSQLRLHLNIHYMERPYRCTACAVSFRTRGHLQKHERSGSHHNKVSMTSTFGAATSLNPRPFKCSDCNVAFRIHGHLAKHLRSKMHVMRLECLFKLPFGTFTEIERAGISLTDIDTTDCASSLTSLQNLAKKLHEKDPSKLEYREPNSAEPMLGGRESSDDEDGIIERTRESETESDIRTAESVECHNADVIFSATE